MDTGRQAISRTQEESFRTLSEGHSESQNRGVPLSPWVWPDQADLPFVGNGLQFRLLSGSLEALSEFRGCFLLFVPPPAELVGPPGAVPVGHAAVCWFLESCPGRCVVAQKEVLIPPPPPPPPPS